MRPRKKVVLLARNSSEVSRWRFVLETRNFRVLGTCLVDEAAAWLEKSPEPIVAVTTVPGRGGADALRQATERVILFGVPKEFLASTSSATCVEREGSDLAARLVDNLKRMTAIKRGPRPKQRPPLLSPIDEDRLLLIAEFDRSFAACCAREMRA